MVERVRVLVRSGEKGRRSLREMKGKVDVIDDDE